MADPTPRSRSSAPDEHSVRRIGEALLLAQNRARLSTERANRSERILRTVLSQINLQSGVLLHELEDYPRSLSFDSLADWDLLRSLVETTALEPGVRYAPLAAERTSFALSMADARGAPHTLSSVPRDDPAEDISAVTRDVVMNLHLAARAADRRIDKMQRVSHARWLPVHGWLARVLQLESYYYLRPWQFMAGLVVGVAIGIVTTRRLLLLEKSLRRSVAPTKYPSALVMDQQAMAPPPEVPTSSMTCRGDALTKRQMTKLHLAASRLPVTFAMEDMSYLLHPPTEVS